MQVTRVGLDVKISLRIVADILLDTLYISVDGACKFL